MLAIKAHYFIITFHFRNLTEWLMDSTVSIGAKLMFFVKIF